MRKFSVLLLVFVLTATLAVFFSGCSHVDSVTVYVPDGGPALGMAYLMKEFQEIEGVKIEYAPPVKGAGDIAAAVANGDADVAILPTNLAAKLYNEGKEIVLVGTNSHGLLYLLSTVASEEDFSLDALKGEVLHLTGESNTPEAVVRKILDSAGIEYAKSDAPIEGKVALKFYADGSGIVPGLVSGSIRYAILGEPAVSNVMQKAAAAKKAEVKIAGDLQALWMAATNTTESYPQTSLVVKKSLWKSDKKLVKKIAKLTIDGSAALLEDATPYLTYLIEEMGSTQVPAALKQEGVIRANIDPTFGSKAKTAIEAYFNILLDFDETLIGGKLPDKDFYCGGLDDLQDYKGIVKAFA